MGCQRVCNCFHLKARGWDHWTMELLCDQLKYQTVLSIEVSQLTDSK